MTEVATEGTKTGREVATGVLVKFDQSGTMVQVRAGVGEIVDFWELTRLEEHRLRKAALALVDEGLVDEGSSYVGVFFGDKQNLLGVSSRAVHVDDDVTDASAWRQLAVSASDNGSDARYGNARRLDIVATSRSVASRISHDNWWLSEEYANEIASVGIAPHPRDDKELAADKRIADLAKEVNSLHGSRVRWVAARQEGNDGDGFDYATSARGGAITGSKALEIADALENGYGEHGDVVLVTDVETGKFSLVQFDGFHPLGVAAAGWQAVVTSMWDKTPIDDKWEAVRLTRFYNEARNV